MKKIKKLLTITILGVIFCLCLFSGCGGIQDKGAALQYELHSNGEYYVVTGKTDTTPKKLEIPSEYKGVPVREIAINELGMVPAEANQIVKYRCPDGCTVMQYAGIPESGIVASSDMVE